MRAAWIALLACTRACASGGDTLNGAIGRSGSRRRSSSRTAPTSGSSSTPRRAPRATRSTAATRRPARSFLRDHRTLADQTCARCHAATFCRDCHSRDHTPLWKRSAHGLDAVSDPRACDRCHTTSPPRDHRSADWRTLGHAMPARLATRRCVICHDAPNECGECHAR